MVELSEIYKERIVTDLLSPIVSFTHVFFSKKNQSNHACPNIRESHKKDVNQKGFYSTFFNRIYERITKPIFHLKHSSSQV